MGNKHRNTDSDWASLKCGGLTVNFPFQPYTIQKAMMARIVVGLTNKEHCLIESPTGTGKTLVLLCASLCWQAQSKKEQSVCISERLRNKMLEARLERLMNRPCSCGRRPDARTELDELNDAKQAEGKPLKNKPIVINIDVDDDDDCCESAPKKAKTSDIEILEEMCKNCLAIKTEEEFTEVMGAGATRVKLSKIPRIYYGTRTHKQIAQVIRELNKTPYKEDVKVCILSSRERTCINEFVKDHADRNDRCQELIKSKGSKSKKKTNDKDSCSYYLDANTMAAKFEQIYEEFKGEVFDIEDAVNFSKKNCLCPYYGLRSIQDQADITFCPYNYLLDPNIRKAMNINLNNSVIIFDEAHNIEDICRDGASLILSTQQIDEITTTIKKISPNYIQGTAIRDAYDFFRLLFENMKDYLRTFNYRVSESQGDCLSKHIMSHEEMIEFLEKIRLSSSNLKMIKENLSALKGDDEESSTDKKAEENQDTDLGGLQLQYITNLANTLDFMYSNNGKYCTDYRCILSKHLVRNRFDQKKPNQSPSGDVHMYQLSLLCMNPGIAFEKIHSQAWSVIVASGTLSPIESLKSELGCKFAQVFEGSHVIAEDRIFATVLSKGPKGIDLNCGFSNINTLPFQDEIGTIIRDVCNSVPNGILCFFPSYERMENMYQRWFVRGYIKDIQASGKKLFREQKNATASKFEEELAKYHKCAKARGALLFAVFRGKASEGIDFSDTAARAVITIGIPYPNIKEVTIGLKRAYNDRARVERPHLMSGSDWYASQAFRALNQALGRCIRHKDDWGAIIMIDSRLNESVVNNISKWIRRVMAINNNYASVQRSLTDFVSKRTTAPSDMIKIEDDDSLC